MSTPDTMPRPPRRRAPLRAAMLLLLTLLAGYALIVLAVWALQDRMLFVGMGQRGAPVPAVFGVDVERVPLPAAAGAGDAATFRVACAGPRDGSARAIVVFFTGNGEDLRSGVHWAALWAEFGAACVVVEYPGYGDSDGAPGTASFYAAAEAAHAFAVERFGDALPVVAGGSSLGSFSAVHLAVSGRADRLFLRAPPTSIEAAGRDRFPWLPIGWILAHRFDNLARAGSIPCPTLVVHGDRDRVVPLAMGARLVDAIGPDRARLVVANGYDHNDLPAHRAGPFGAEIDAFLPAR